MSEPADRRDPLRSDRRRMPRPGGRRTDDPPPDWVSITEFAQRYGVTRGKVYEWLAAKILWTYQVGTLTRIRNLPPDDHRVARDLHQRAHLSRPECS